MSGIYTALVLVFVSTLAACGVQPARVLDWGLHRQWVIMRDCEHAERPAQLVEVPWSDSWRAEVPRPAQGSARVATAPAATSGPVVHAGTRVTVIGQGRDATTHLAGTALEAGKVGNVIRVQAGWGRATLHCTVRGPAVVELIPEKGRN